MKSSLAFPYPFSSPSTSNLTNNSTVVEVLWAFSIYLEAVAVFPQLFMLHRTGEAETITTHYLFALGLYRAMYIPNWILRFVPSALPLRIYSLLLALAHSGMLWSLHIRYTTENTLDPIAIFSGIVQTGLYADFFYSTSSWSLHLQSLQCPNLL
jgi:ER lumen protein retaining receptor